MKDIIVRVVCAQEDTCAIDYHDGQWFIDGEAVTQ